MVKLTKKEIKSAFVFSFCVSAAVFLAGCQKSQESETPAALEATTSPASQATSSAPTGLVKNATRHTEDTANVTKWWDIAEKKTAAQTAREEKLAKEARDLKLAQEAKQAQESRIAATKAAANVREAIKPAVLAPQAPVTAKAVEITQPPVVVAAKTATAPVQAAPESDVLRLISNTQPVFPISAVKAGLAQGTVSARLFIEKNGSVSKVEIIEARPRKYFDREVITALSTWKYAPISNSQTKVIEVNFKADN